MAEYTREDAMPAVEAIRRGMKAGKKNTSTERVLLETIIRGECRISRAVWLWLQQIRERTEAAGEPSHQHD